MTAEIIRFHLALVAKDKLEWADGPWQREPDRVEWRSQGLACLILRAARLGYLCGYVGVPPGHPYHGKDGGDVKLTAHGSVNYSEACAGHICHVPAPGEPDDLWWFGFDCGHGWDLAPMMALHIPGWDQAEMLPRYRDLSYVTAEVESLAKQLAEAAR